MKKAYLSILIAAVAGGALADNWLYDSASGTVSDGVWTFNASVNAGRIAFNDCTGYPETVTPIDFSKPVSDGENALTISTLEGLFGYYLNGVQDSPTARDSAAYVGGVTFPAEGLVTIGNCAFFSCTSLTGTVRFPSSITTIGRNAFHNVTGVTSWENTFPDSLTSVGRLAFHKSSLSGDIRLINVTDFNNYAHFANTYITSVTFGNGNLVFGGGWNAGPFCNCSLLTNVVFGSGMTGGNLKSSGAAFQGCPLLKDLDLRGFSKLGDTGTFQQPLPSVITNVSIGSNLTSLKSVFFNGATKLAYLNIYGVISESAIEAPIFGSLSPSQTIVTYVHLDKDDPNYAEQKAAWDAMTAGGSINGTTSVWKESLAGVNYASRFLLLAGEEEEEGELGVWVYDNGVVSDGTWSFNATCAGIALSIGECCGNPTEMSEINFNQRVTDAHGHELVITSLDPKFSVVGLQPYYNPGAAQHGAEYIGSVILPTNGLASIGMCAFGNCSNLTNVWPLLPDSVLSVGNSAFAGCSKLTGPLSLKGVTYINYGVFRSTKVTEVTFGPKLTGFSSAWGCASFGDCTSITNVVFDPHSNISSFSGSTYGAFYGCTSLGGTNGAIDISAFTKMPTYCKVFPGCPVEMLILGTNITVFTSAFFDAEPSYGVMAKLKRIRFLGAPPANFASVANLFTSIRGGNLVYPVEDSIVTEVPYAFRSEWAPYCEQGAVSNRGTYLKAELVGGEDFRNKRPLVFFDYKPGITIIYR